MPRSSYKICPTGLRDFAGSPFWISSTFLRTSGLIIPFSRSMSPIRLAIYSTFLIWNYITDVSEETTVINNIAAIIMVVTNKLIIFMTLSIRYEVSAS